MADGIYIALSGAVAESRALDTVAHNIANASTAGFRAERLTFAEALKRADGDPHPQTQVVRQSIDTTSGAIMPTGNELDVAMSGPGYFAIETPTGVRYTRNGSFHLDQDGTVVSADGHAVLDRDGGHLSIPAGTKRIAIAKDGTVDADGEIVGQILRARLDGDSLIQEGTNLALTPDARVTEEEDGQVVQGSIEKSNFDAVRGMVELIRVSRSYQSLTRMIEGYQELDRATLQKLGG